MTIQHEYPSSDVFLEESIEDFVQLMNKCTNLDIGMITGTRNAPQLDIDVAIIIRDSALYVRQNIQAHQAHGQVREAVVVDQTTF